MIKPITVVFLLLLLAGCKGDNNNARQQKEDGRTEEKRTFQQVTVPTMITDPIQRAEYAATHYWDKFDFADTAYIHLPEVTEQAFANYIGIVMYSSPEVASVSIKKLLKQAEAEKKVYDYFITLFEKYLYDPNSPMRNDEYYIPVLEAMIESPVLDDVNKIRPTHLLELAQKNRVGKRATDFVYTKPDGATGRLNNVKADYLILYFYNPDCSACQEYTEAMSASVLINDLKKQGVLNILAIYPDEDLQEWKQNISKIPADWIVGYDREVKIKSEELYDLKAIPMLYLLDKDKNVILKDVTFVGLSEYLVSLVQ